ncbi:cysteine--tRNA ligase [Pacificibacter marinus]|uniref:cysteine--tRNA ligase n=1 Tax=Pacificibacter marinus TaxID=658057 RepID=UPI001C06E4D7|nr:cysteine--tRNA ligase [Pacificibacter marinus]MBU2867969.1 cysteine--tRNA ligase [Pacificibacter marinus]
MTNANTETVIRLTNTKTRKKEVFTPIDAQNVRMYVCGPTVYDRAHIGNARPVIVFDVLNRLLRHVYGADHVTYVRNFTDVDDKINAKAAETGRSIRDITDETTQWYLDDMQAVGAMDPDHMPRATEYIDQMITMIEGLIAKKHAYPDGAGHVLFSVNSYPHYGDLSGRNTDDMIAGARVEIADNKLDPMDFVLWKPSDAETPGWDSPWGKGRPGWHIECSAMAEDILWKKPLEAGELSDSALAHPHTFDIHGGGNDLMFPHHENEIAQSCCASGHAEDGAGFANYWLHNEMLQVEGKKMSKSLGNFFTVRDLLEKYQRQFAIDNIGPAIRLRFLQTHYRSPMDVTGQSIEDAAVKLDNWARILESFSVNKSIVSEPNPVILALADDLNTSKAISEMDKLHSFLSEPYLSGTVVSGNNDRSQEILWFNEGFEILGFTLDGINSLRHSVWSEKLKSVSINTDVSKLIEALLEERRKARQDKDWARADELRDAFANSGVAVSDTSDGVSWELMQNFDPSKLEGLL